MSVTPTKILHVKGDVDMTRSNHSGWDVVNPEINLLK